MMSRLLAERMAVLVMAITLGACGDSPTAPSAGITGVWVGTMTGWPGVGTMRFEVTERGPGVSGTFTLTLPDPSLHRSGSVTGLVSGALVNLTFTPVSALVCSSTVTLSGALSATMTSTGERMTGSYSSFTCGSAIGGAIDVQRQ
jgi:hypothetical protein